MPLFENIQWLCEQNHITIYKLEQETDLTKGSIRKWKNSLPSSDKLYKVAKYFNVTMESLIESQDKNDFKKINFLDKMITATKDKKVTWFKYSTLYGLKYHEKSLASIFSLYPYEEFDSDWTVDERNTFYMVYRTGGYLLATIKNSNISKTIIAFFIYFDGTFTLYATSDDNKLLESLFKAVRVKVLGIDYLVNSFLIDDFKQDPDIKNCLMCGKPLDLTKDRNGMCTECRIKYTGQD